MTKYFWVAVSLCAAWGIIGQLRYWRTPPPLANMWATQANGQWIVPHDMYHGDWVLIAAPMKCEGTGFSTESSLNIGGKPSPETRYLNPYLAYARMP